MDFIKFMMNAALNILIIGLGFTVFYVIIRYGRKITHIISKAIRKGIKALDKKLDAKEPTTQQEKIDSRSDFEKAQAEFDDAFRDIVHIR